METLKRVSFSALLLLFLVVTIGFLLPRKIHVERSKLMQASRKNLFGQVNTVRNWAFWSPWHQLDSAMEVNYFGVEGKGSGFRWKSANRKVGEGKLEIIVSKPYDSILLSIEFIKALPVASAIIFSEENGLLKSSWTLDVELKKNPFLRYFGLFMDRWIGKDFERGLAQLDSAALKQDLLHPPLQMEVRELQPFQYVFLERTLRKEELSSSISKTYDALLKQFPNPETEIAGAPFVLYLDYDTVSFHMEIGYPVAKGFTPPKNMHLKQFMAERALVGRYQGPYSGLQDAYTEMNAYLAKMHLMCKPFTMESYLTDPELEPDPSKWITEIYFFLTDK